MNSIHNNGGNNGSLDKDLDHLGQAYRELQQDEPPELLDQAILNSAHRAVEKQSHWTQFGWLHGLTTAAVFVLALSLILNQREAPPVDSMRMQDAEPNVMSRQKAAKKERGADTQMSPNDIRASVSEEAESPGDVLESKAAVAAPASVVNERVLEEPMLYEADTVVDKAPAGATPEQLSGSATPEPAIAKLRQQTEKDAAAEQIILNIIKLKQSGDESWRTELDAFRQQYPDYPLPEALAN